MKVYTWSWFQDYEDGGPILQGGAGGDHCGLTPEEFIPQTPCLTQQAAMDAAAEFLDWNLKKLTWIENPLFGPWVARKRTINAKDKFQGKSWAKEALPLGDEPNLEKGWLTLIIYEHTIA